MGDDAIETGSGDDTAYGCAGNDALVADGGNDTVLGDTRDDLLSVAGGANRVNALSGDDTVAYVITGVAKTLNGGRGDDLLLVPSDRSPLYFIVGGSNGRVDDDSLSVITGFERDDARGGSLNDIAGLSIGNDTADGGWTPRWR